MVSLDPLFILYMTGFCILSSRVTSGFGTEAVNDFVATMVDKLQFVFISSESFGHASNNDAHAITSLAT